MSAGPEEAQREGVSYGLQTIEQRRAARGKGEEGAAAAAAANAAAANAAAAAAAAPDPLAGLSVTSREWEAARYKQDLESLPEEGGEEAYDRMPVASFARALLRGMGWKEEEQGGGEGAAVGRDGKRVEVGVVEFLPRPAGLGLGASLGPSAGPEAPRKTRDRRWETHSGPLSSSSSAPSLAAAAAPPPRGATMVDASGRVRHSRRLGEELRPASEFGAAAPLRPGAKVVVTGGAHSGVSASVVGDASSSSAAPPSSSSSFAAAAAAAALVRIRLFPSDEEVVVRREHLEEGAPSNGGGGGGGGSGGSRKRGGGDDGRRGDSDRRSSSPPPSATKRQRSSRSPPPPSTISRWLLPGIVVKIVDKRLEGGRFYLKRAKVIDVPAPGIATLAIISSSSSASLSGVRASSLETAVPREPGSAVVVVEGQHRGRRGRLLARMEAEKGGEPSGAVQLRGDLEVVRLPLDWFAEAAGGGGRRGGGDDGGGDGGDDE